MANTLGLLYQELPHLRELGVLVTRPATIFKDIRRVIKPYFTDQQLAYDNPNGAAAIQFNSGLGRYGWNWLEFEILSGRDIYSHYPDDQYLSERWLVRDTEYYTLAQWQEKLAQQIAQQQVFLLLALNTRLQEEKGEHPSLHMFSGGGLPESYFPRVFTIKDACVTNAPDCWLIQSQRLI